MGGITEIATARPAATRSVPKPARRWRRPWSWTATPPLVGKCHEVPCGRPARSAVRLVAQPGGGFEHFYGFIGGKTNQYYPAILRGDHGDGARQDARAGLPLHRGHDRPGYHADPPAEDVMPDKPFFLYFAPGATHARTTCPRSGRRSTRASSTRAGTRSAKRLRAAKAARHRPAGHGAAAATDIPAGTSSPRMKPVLARQMESMPASSSTPTITSAVSSTRSRTRWPRGHARYTSWATTERAPKATHGTFNELINLNGASALQTTEFMAERIDEFGTPSAYNHYAVGWAHAMDPRTSGPSKSRPTGAAPATAPSCSGDGIEAKGKNGASSTTWSFAPTVLDAAGLPEPKTVHGVEQKPIEGVSMRYAFDDAGAAERRETQYFEMFCNRGIYDKGWTAVTRHSIPWVPLPTCPRFPTTPGSSTTRAPTGARHTTSRPRCPRSSRNWRRSSWRRRGSTTCSRSTTGASSGSTPTSPGARRFSRATRNSSSAAWAG